MIFLVQALKSMAAAGIRQGLVLYIQRRDASHIVVANLKAVSCRSRNDLGDRCQTVVSRFRSICASPYRLQPDYRLAMSTGCNQNQTYQKSSDRSALICRDAGRPITDVVSLSPSV